MAKASELLSKLARTSRRNDLVSAIAQDILKRTKCDPNLLNVEFEDEDNDNPAIATFTYTFANGRVVPIIWEENQDPNKTIDDDFRTLMYQQFIADIINDVCDREKAKRKAQEELDRRAAVILFRQLAEDLVEGLRHNGKLKNPIGEPKPAPEPKSNPVLTQSQIEAIEKAGGFPISDNEEVLTFHTRAGGRTSLLRNPNSRFADSRRDIVQYTCMNSDLGGCQIDVPIEAFNIPEEKIIAVFPPCSDNGPTYLTAPRGDEFWYQGKVTLVCGSKKTSGLWLTNCGGVGNGHNNPLIMDRSALCLVIQAKSEGTENCSGPIR